MNKWLKWGIKGFIYTIIATVVLFALTILYAAFTAISPIIGIILMLPFLIIAFIVKGFLLEWINKTIK